MPPAFRVKQHLYRCNILLAEILSLQESAIKAASVCNDRTQTFPRIIPLPRRVSYVNIKSKEFYSAQKQILAPRCQRTELNH